MGRWCIGPGVVVGQRIGLYGAQGKVVRCDAFLAFVRYAMELLRGYLPDQTLRIPVAATSADKKDQGFYAPGIAALATHSRL